MVEVRACGRALLLRVRQCADDSQCAPASRAQALGALATTSGYERTRMSNISATGCVRFFCTSWYLQSAARPLAICVH